MFWLPEVSPILCSSFFNEKPRFNCWWTNVGEACHCEMEELVYNEHVPQMKPCLCEMLIVMLPQFVNTQY